MIKNTSSGKFIVIEGLDGSGKSTQNNLLTNRLRKEGHRVEKTDFPQYGKKSAGLVEEYLNGKYGPSEEVGPYRASIFYACDRYDASFEIKKWLKEKKIVISDRYVASNIGHQGGKIKNKKEREKFFKWLYDLEYNFFGIPRPDFTFILKTSPSFSLKLANKITDKEKIAKRKAYLGNSSVRDIHEKDRQHLACALKSYLHIAELYPKEFKIIECIERDKLLPPEIIHQKIWGIIKGIL
ncbi:dTMP kinase [Patescibacteria group bacterium]|nr:dTMP kinase [Patescibacteria group bacterium]